MNFLENILERLAPSPARVVLEELRPTGKVAVTAGQLLESIAAARAFFVASGLRNADRLHKAAMNLQHADGTEAAWWLGLMARQAGKRTVRALRILVEAVK